MNNPSLFFVVLGLAFSVTVCGQTNTFPASGNVGIGTTTPGTKLQIAVPANGADGIQITRPSSPTWQLMNYGPFYIQEAGIGPRLVVAPGGNVGIGTSGPSVKLELSKPSASPTLSAYCGTLSISQPDLFTSLQVGGNGSAPYGLWLQGTNNSGASFPILLNPLGGNVGIGTSSPSAKLELARPSASPTLSAYCGTLSVSQPDLFTSLQIGGYGSAPYGLWLQGTNNSSASFPILLNPLGGNVGIGTSTPTQKLSVNGTILAKEVIVQTNWSDYVFAKDYVLQPLSAVEQSIKKEGHLPGIPSQREVEEKGISVGNMEAKLLAKIEELTLRQIEQEKRVNAQAARIDHLENENAQLRASR